MTNQSIQKLVSFVFLFILGYFSYSQKIGFELQSGHTVAIDKLLLSENNELLFSTSKNENSIFIWQTSSGKKIKTLYAKGASITGLSLSQKKNEVLSIDADGTVIVWDYVNGEQKSSYRIKTTENSMDKSLITDSITPP